MLVKFLSTLFIFWASRFVKGLKLLVEEKIWSIIVTISSSFSFTLDSSLRINLNLSSILSFSSLRGFIKKEFIYS